METAHPKHSTTIGLADIRVSDHGAKIAASRIGCTVEEYREREAASEFWCGLGQHWVTQDVFHWTGRAGKSRSGRCTDCAKADARQRYVPQRAHVPNLRGVRYAGPAYSLTPKGAAATMPNAASPEGRPDAAPVAYPDRRGSDHSSCPPSIRHLCKGQLPEGWVRARQEAAS